MVSEVNLTKQELAELIWMAKVNDENDWGLYWPTVRRYGVNQTPICEDLCKRSLATKKHDSLGYHDLGYWITPAGRAAIAEGGKP